jgi:hypothetical protein
MGGGSNYKSFSPAEILRRNEKIQQEEIRKHSLNLYELTAEYLDNKINIFEFEKLAKILREKNAK